jgi:thiamine-phosphate pyrophosphorylase
VSEPRFDPALYLVADFAACGGRGVVATVRAAIAGGVTAVQLRHHGTSTRSLYGEAIELRHAVLGTGVTLLVDDRLDVAMATGADGVHLGQSDLPVEKARAIAGSEFVIGWSVTNRAEAEAAAALDPGVVDYLGVGPIYPTTTKPDASPPMGIEELSAICRISRIPCVAIGGVTKDRVAALLDAGVVGVAVVSAICAAEDPRAAAAELRDALAGERR